MRTRNALHVILAILVATAAVALVLAACHPIGPTPTESPISPISPPPVIGQAIASITGSIQVHWDDPTMPRGSGYYTVACSPLEDTALQSCLVADSSGAIVGRPVTCSATLSDCFGYRLYADVQLRTLGGAVLRGQTVDTGLGASAVTGTGQYDGDIPWSWGDFCGTIEEWIRLRWTSKTGMGDTLYLPYHLDANGDLLPLDAQFFSKNRVLYGSACYLYYLAVIHR